MRRGLSSRWGHHSPMLGCGMATRNEVYQAFGLTAEAAQLFETELGTIAYAAEGHRRGWRAEPDPQAAVQFLEKLDRKTLGQLLATVRKDVQAEERIEALFDAALQYRNRLNHGFFLSHNFAVFSEVGCDAMIAELEVMRLFLTSAYETASAIARVVVSRARGDAD